VISTPTRKLLSLAFVTLILISQAAQLAFHSAADTRPAEDRGAMALGQAIKRLGVVASVLHTGAHPDDEDSGLLAYLARECRKPLIARGFVRDGVCAPSGDCVGSAS